MKKQEMFIKKTMLLKLPSLLGALGVSVVKILYLISHVRSPIAYDSIFF